MQVTYALFQQRSHLQLKSELYSVEKIIDAQVFTRTVDVLVNSLCLSCHLD